MPRRKESDSDNSTPSRRRPAATPEARETQMIALADQLAEQQLRDGTASAQVVTHFLKLGSSREKLEQVKLALETKLVQAKTDQIESMQRSEAMFAEAIKAMSMYQGRGGTTPTPLSYEPPQDTFVDEGYYEG